MCGIIGAFGAGIEPNWVEKHIMALERRGPDSKNWKIIDEFCTLGATRLAMVDPLPRSNQPFVRNDKILVFNGEIYNYRNLKAHLCSQSSFETDSDTEVLLALMEEKGIASRKLIDGMYAFAFYDKEAKTLILARDDLGKKPLYYVLSRGNLYFSSLQEPLKQFKGEINSKALYEYLSFGYVLDPDSFNSQIMVVMPGEYMKFQIVGERVINIGKSEKNFTRTKTKSTRVEFDLRSQIIASVKSRVEGYKNVAISLSGGIDSSVIAVALSELGVQATGFSVRWPDSDKARYNEDSIRAQKIANQLKHDFIFVDSFETNKLKDRIDLYLKIMEEPSSNSTGLSMIDLYAKMAESGFRLAITGDGADEFFGGYKRYEKMVSLSKMPLSGLSSYSIKKLLSIYNGEETNLANFNFWARWHRTFGHREALLLVGNFLSAAHTPDLQLIQKYIRYEKGYRHSALKQIQSLDQRIWLSMESNRRLDRISMYHSVEARSPFQDLLSQNQFLDAKERFLKKSIGKANLIAAFPELSKLPISPVKVGFVSPLGHWLRSNFDFVRGSLEFIQEILGIPPQKTNEMLANLNRGEFVLLRKTWSLVILSRFLEKEFADEK